jgi:hypothetical protein
MRVKILKLLGTVLSYNQKENEMSDIQVTVKCSQCGKDFAFNVNEQGYEEWRSGALIQECLKENTPEERELLISNTCNVCWDELFPYDEDD